jgi:hypothetical protein
VKFLKDITEPFHIPLPGLPTGSGYPEIDKRVERFVNKTKEFPDFRDILDIVANCNKKCELSLS